MEREWERDVLNRGYGSLSNTVISGLECQLWHFLKTHQWYYCSIFIALEVIGPTYVTAGVCGVQWNAGCLSETVIITTNYCHDTKQQLACSLVLFMLLSFPHPHTVTIFKAHLALSFSWANATKISCSTVGSVLKLQCAGRHSLVRRREWVWVLFSEGTCHVNVAGCICL